MAQFEIFKDHAGQYRWRLRADNGEPIADSSEAYKAKADCRHGIDLVKRESPSASVEDKS
ncbi:MAG TPA: DUF1508 domain-containing protein [Isosphaeraceae bacterium]|jgi:uncharacterized protein YegP (UPF0339 family)